MTNNDKAVKYISLPDQSLDLDKSSFYYRFIYKWLHCPHLLGPLPLSHTVLPRKMFVLNCGTEVSYLAQGSIYYFADSCSVSFPLQSLKVRFWVCFYSVFRRIWSSILFFHFLAYTKQKFWQMQI